MFEIDEAGRPSWTKRVGDATWRLFYWRDPDGRGKEDGWTVALFDEEGACPQAMLYPDLESAILKWAEIGGFGSPKV